MSQRADSAVMLSAERFPRIARLAGLLRRIIGAPDYAAYVAHVRVHHPEREPLCEREFLTERLNARYEKPGARCC